MLSVEVGKRDGLDFVAEIWAIKLPCGVGTLIKSSSFFCLNNLKSLQEDLDFLLEVSHDIMTFVQKNSETTERLFQSPGLPQNPLLIKEVCLQKCSSLILCENDFHLSDSRSLRWTKTVMVLGFLLTFCDMPSLGGPKMMLSSPHRLILTFSSLPLAPPGWIWVHNNPSVLCSWSLPMSNDYAVGFCSLAGWSWDSAGGLLQHWKPCLRIQKKK